MMNRTGALKYVVDGAVASFFLLQSKFCDFTFQTFENGVKKLVVVSFCRRSRSMIK
jgi:hypothetical protein